MSQQTVTKDVAILAKPTRSFKRTLAVLTIASASFLALCFIAHAAWRFSGSNQWRVVAEYNGAKVYGLKQPGSDLEQFKGVVRVRSTVSGFVAWLQDLDTCKDAGCEHPKIIEKVNDQLEYVSYQFRMPGPFQRREFVLRARFQQISNTGEFWAEYAAAADKAPPTEGCLRVTNMNNTWRATPVGNGQLELEYAMNMDWGGFFPDAMSNVVRPKYMLMQLQRLQGYLDREKFKTAKFDFIHEPAPTPAVRQNASGTRSTAQR